MTHRIVALPKSPISNQAPHRLTEDGADLRRNLRQTCPPDINFNFVRYKALSGIIFCTYLEWYFNFKQANKIHDFFVVVKIIKFFFFSNKPVTFEKKLCCISDVAYIFVSKLWRATGYWFFIRNKPVWNYYPSPWRWVLGMYWLLPGLRGKLFPSAMFILTWRLVLMHARTKVVSLYYGDDSSWCMFAPTLCRFRRGLLVCSKAYSHQDCVSWYLYTVYCM